MYSADEIYDTAELENIPAIPPYHFTDIDIDDIEDVDQELPGSDGEDNSHSEDQEPCIDFGGSFHLSVEYDDDNSEPTNIDHDDDDWF